MSHLELKETTDTNFITYIVSHEDLYDLITDDECPPDTKERMPEMIDATKHLYKYMTVLKDSEPVGLLITHEEPEGLQLHLNLLKNARGVFAFKVGKEICNKLLPKHKLIVKVPSLMKHVFKFVTALGFKLEYMEEKVYPKNGTLYDVYTFSMSLEK